MHGTKNTPTCVYTVSWPPSTNDLWRAVKGRNILSRRARLWTEAASLELIAQGIERIIGPVHVRVELNSPWKRPYDPDNRIKALLDLLVKNSILEDDKDSIIHRLEIVTRGFEATFTGARVTIEGLSP